MPVSQEKSIVSAVIPQTAKEELEKIAQEQDRSMSNLIAIILKDYVKQKKTQNEDFQAENKKSSG
jgi:metal-responsive CopG/Arc/MetJ family transcriptional regulator